MLFSAPLAFGLLSLVSASPMRRAAPAISVELSAPAKVDSIADLSVVTKITNEGKQAIKVLKHNTPLVEGKHADLFDVSGVDFLGVRSTFSLSHALKTGGDSIFADLAPGQTVTTSHPVGSLYNFEKSGEGEYKIVSKLPFHYVAEDSKTPASMNDLSLFFSKSNSVTVKVSGDLSSGKFTSSRFAKRAQVNSCSDDQVSFINTALQEQHDMAQKSIDHISANGADDLYTSYFSSNDPATVQGDFQTLADVDYNNDGTDQIFECDDPAGACSSDGVIAYTVSGSYVNFCEGFYSLVDVSDLCSGATTIENGNLFAGALLHEQTHYYLGTQDITYGSDNSIALASQDASQAIQNADNFAYYSYSTACDS